MTEREIADWEREIKHAERMQEQRKRQELKEGVYKFDKEHTSWNSNDRRKGFRDEK